MFVNYIKIFDTCHLLNGVLSSKFIFKSGFVDSCGFVNDLFDCIFCDISSLISLTVHLSQAELHLTDIIDSRHGYCVAFVGYDNM
jgi:hypothetical protein